MKMHLGLSTKCGWPRRLVMLATGLALLGSLPVPAQAQGGGRNVIVVQPVAPAATSRQLYQARVGLACNSTTKSCSGSLPRLTASQVLELKNIACHIKVRMNGTTTGESFKNLMSHDSSATAVFKIDLARLNTTQVSQGGINYRYHVLGQPISYFVPAGKQLSFSMEFDGVSASDAYCVIFGERVTTT